MNLTRGICIVGVPSAWVFRFYFPSFARGARRSAERRELRGELQLTAYSQSVQSVSRLPSPARVFTLFQIVKEADRTGSQLFLVVSDPFVHASVVKTWVVKGPSIALGVAGCLLFALDTKTKLLIWKKDTHFSSLWRILHSRRPGNTKCSAGPTPITVVTGRTRTNFRVIFLKSMFGNAVGRKNCN